VMSRSLTVRRGSSAPWQGGRESRTGGYVNQQAVHPAYRLLRTPTAQADPNCGDWECAFYDPDPPYEFISCHEQNSCMIIQEPPDPPLGYLCVCYTEETCGWWSGQCG
jgi:hypothetical protein